MSSLASKIKLYASESGVPQVDFLSDVILFNEGNGAYIKEWNLEIPKPSDATLAQYETQAETKDALEAIQNQRAVAYPSIADQLDQIYHEGIDAWKETIAAVKAEYPKP